MRTVETTPTMVRHGPGCLPLPSTVRKRRPSGLSRAEVLLRERGVDDRDGLLRVEIVVGELAAFEQPLPGDLEEAAA